MLTDIRRQRLEQVIERAIDLLNEIDGDPDLELEPDSEPDHWRRRPPKGYVGYEIECGNEGRSCKIELVILEPDGSLTRTPY